MEVGCGFRPDLKQSYLEASNEDRRKLPQEKVVWNSDSNWGPLAVSSDEGQVGWGLREWGEGRVL